MRSTWRGEGGTKQARRRTDTCAYESGYLTRPTEEARMSRYLVVANQTIGGSELMAEIRRRIASGPSSFYVVVPSMPAGVPDWDRLAVGADADGIRRIADMPERAEALRDRAEKVSLSRL